MSSINENTMSMGHDGPVVGGFNFENLHRNAMIANQVNSAAAAMASAGAGASAGDVANPSYYLPSAKKTGTTIVGVVYRDGVILGADTRATSGSEVAEKNCMKLHYIAPNIYCAGAGTAADTEKTTELISSQLQLLRYNNNKTQSRVVTAQSKLKRMLFQYQGYISAALILGGCDVNGPHLYQIYPHGSTSKLPYVSMGSGSIAAMSILETDWREDMSETDAVALIHRAIGAGIFNDLGSGSCCDLVLIRSSAHEYSVDYRRNDVKPNELQPLRAMVQRSGRLDLPSGTTPVLSSSYQSHPVNKSTTNTATLADVAVTEMEVEG